MDIIRDKDDLENKTKDLEEQRACVDVLLPQEETVHVMSRKECIEVSVVCETIYVVCGVALMGVR